MSGASARGRDPIGQLLRVKRVREQRAAARLNTARTAERAADAAHADAQAALAAHETGRASTEAAIYRSLSGAAVPGLRVQLAGATLAGLQSRAAALGRIAETAAAAATACTQTMRTAQAAHAAALRERSGAEEMHAQLAALRDACVERQDEAELEETASRRLVSLR